MTRKVKENKKFQTSQKRWAKNNTSSSKITWPAIKTLAGQQQNSDWVDNKKSLENFVN